MGGKASRVCWSCFSRTRRRSVEVTRVEKEGAAGQGEKERTGLYLPVTTEDPLLTERKASSPTPPPPPPTDPRSWFDLKAVTKSLDLALLELLKELEVPAAQDPTLELLINTEDFKVFGKDTEHGLMLKTNWTVPYSPDVYISFIRDFEARKRWDRNIEECRKLCYLAPDISINYQRYKKMMVVSKRELLVACRTVPLGDSVLDVSCSVETEEIPVAEDVVRARLHLGGYHVQPCEAGTKITAISVMDFGGAVPKPVLKRMSAFGLLLFTKALGTALARAQQPEANANH